MPIVTVTAAGETATATYGTTPLETVTFSDFTAAGGTIGLMLPATGYTGQGIVGTTLLMKPHTSTKTAPSSGTNPLRLLRTNPGTGGKFGGFTLQGTEQGHLYGGLLVTGQTSATVTDLLVTGIPGNSGAPPGETFGVATWQCNGVTLTRVEVDGRNTTGVRVGASGLACNSDKNIQWIDCHVHDHEYGMPTCWETVNFTTRTLRSINNVRGVNHERASGVIRHYSPVLQLDPTKANLMHMSFNSDIADCPDIEIHDPTWSGGPAAAGGALAFTIGDSYPGGKWQQKQKTIPRVFYGGTPFLVAEAGSPGNPAAGVPATPSRNMAAAKADPKHSVVIFR
jgi:hypothetical protein